MPAAMRARYSIGWLAEFVLAPGRTRELVRYVAACAAALAFDTAIFLALIDMAGTAAPLAGAIGYTGGLLLNYAIAVRYIFAAEATGKSGRRLLAEYLVSGLAGVVLTTAIIALVASVAGAPPLIAKAVAVAATFLAIYLVRSAAIFAPREGAAT